MDLGLWVLKLELRDFCAVHFYSRQIEGIFETAGFHLENGLTPNSKRHLVEMYYEGENWHSEEAARKLFEVIEHILQVHYVERGQKEVIRRLLADLGIQVEGTRIIHDIGAAPVSDFRRQFPAGLPFGKFKPNLAIRAAHGAQSLRFEVESRLGVIYDGVYPDFTFRMIEEQIGVDNSTNMALKNALVAMNQTPLEEAFFKRYARHFSMADNHVPVLIPQAWIQWHSLPKRALHAASSLSEEDLYRADFVAFWNNRRYIIPIDDISHYGVQRGKNNRWEADEPTYADRLKEDRKLRNEGWEVFRISNWELRNEARLTEILEDFQKLVGFH